MGTCCETWGSFANWLALTPGVDVYGFSRGDFNEWGGGIDLYCSDSDKPYATSQEHAKVKILIILSIFVHLFL